MRSVWTLTALVAVVLWQGCGEPHRGVAGNAKGGLHYGGMFNWNEAMPVGDLFPLGLATAAEFRVASLVYQGLVRLDPADLTVAPCLASSWTVSEDGRIYTFTLRKDVRFHADAALFPDGAPTLQAGDVAACFKRLCTASADNQMFWLFQGRVKGADEHYYATQEGRPAPELSGVRVKDDLTLEIELLRPEPLFLQILAHQGCWIYPEGVAQAKPGKRPMVGTGPFRLHTRAEDGTMVFERAPAYWDRDEHGNALPYLDGARVTFEADRSKELDEFLNGHLSVLVDPPLERMGELTDSIDRSTGALRFHLSRIPSLAVQFYGFNAGKPPFNDLRVRRAFALAIDQQVLVDSVLNGSAMVAGHGLVPTGLKDYPNDQVHGLLYDPDSARKLLAEAGYPGGKGFPTVRLHVNNAGFGYVRVAEAVQAMIERELGIGLLVSVLPADQHYAMVDNGHALLWRQGWVADYPDPENYLALLYGRNAVLDTARPSPLNTTRYANARFDSLYQEARMSTDHRARMRLLAMAEDQAMRDATVAPLYHERLVRLTLPWLKGLPENAMDLRDLSRVWIDPAMRGR